MAELEAWEDEIPPRIIAALTNMSGGNLEDASVVLDELKKTSAESIDYLFGLLLGLVNSMSERLSVEEDEIIQVMALRMHLKNEGVEVDDLPDLNFVGSLPSEEAEKVIRDCGGVLEKIEKTVSAALRESGSMPQEESDVYRGEALTVVGKLAHAGKEKAK